MLNGTNQRTEETIFQKSFEKESEDVNKDDPNLTEGQQPDRSSKEGQEDHSENDQVNDRPRYILRDRRPQIRFTVNELSRATMMMNRDLRRLKRGRLCRMGCSNSVGSLQTQQSKLLRRRRTAEERRSLAHEVRAQNDAR